MADDEPLYDARAVAAADRRQDRRDHATSRVEPQARQQRPPSRSRRCRTTTHRLQATDVACMRPPSTASKSRRRGGEGGGVERREDARGFTPSPLIMNLGLSDLHRKTPLCHVWDMSKTDV